MDKTVATQLVLITELKKALGALERDLRTKALTDSDPGDRKAADAAGTKVGTVTVTDPKEANRVVDGPAFLAWVKATHPDEIITTEAVRSSFEKAMLERGCDEAGEALPGVEPVAGEPHIMVRTERGALDALLAQMEADGLTLGQVLDSMKAIES